MSRGLPFFFARVVSCDGFTFGELSFGSDQNLFRKNNQALLAFNHGLPPHGQYHYFCVETIGWHGESHRVIVTQ
jgi:hypothetical protein